MQSKLNAVDRISVILGDVVSLLPPAAAGYTGEEWLGAAVKWDFCQVHCEISKWKNLSLSERVLLGGSIPYVAHGGKCGFGMVPFTTNEHRL